MDQCPPACIYGRNDLPPQLAQLGGIGNEEVPADWPGEELSAPTYLVNLVSDCGRYPTVLGDRRSAAQKQLDSRDGHVADASKVVLSAIVPADNGEVAPGNGIKWIGGLHSTPSPIS